MEIKLKAGDVLVYINDKDDPWSWLNRYVAGPYSHVALYLGKWKETPMQFESEARGIVLNSLQYHHGYPVAVMRPTSLTEGQIKAVINQAIKIAGLQSSFYDYFAIVKSCIPRVLKEKWPWLPIPLKYQRDAWMICSEAVAEPFWAEGIVVVSMDEVPLPSDFVYSGLLNFQGEGHLMEDILP